MGIVTRVCQRRGGRLGAAAAATATEVKILGLLFIHIDNIHKRKMYFTVFNVIRIVAYSSFSL